MLQTAIVEHVRDLNFDPTSLSQWALAFLQIIILVSAKEIRALEDLDSELLTLVGLAHPLLIGPLV